MTHPVGFSTGALAGDDFRRALEISRQAKLDAVELSALRRHELEPLVDALDELETELAWFRHVSFHAPSAFPDDDEETVVALLERAFDRGIPLVVHPDVIRRPPLWRRFGPALRIENMDDRKPVGQTVDDLLPLFRELPDARLCFDAAHSRQVDPTLGEAERLLLRFADRVAEVHVSHVDEASTHHPLTDDAIAAFRDLAFLVPPQVPLIVESPLAEPVTAEAAAREAERARAAFEHRA